MSHRFKIEKIADQCKYFGCVKICKVYFEESFNDLLSYVEKNSEDGKLKEDVSLRDIKKELFDCRRIADNQLEKVMQGLDIFNRVNDYWAQTDAVSGIKRHLDGACEFLDYATSYAESEIIPA